jgi:hypothetical protein
VSGKGNLATRINGISTGPVFVKILDPSLVPDMATYFVDFISGDSGLVYNAHPQSFLSETFVSKDTVNVPLKKRNIDLDSIVVTDAGGAVVPPSRYSVNGGRGLIRGTSGGTLPAGASFTIKYRYFVTYQSSSLANQDDNPVFDGMKLYVQNVPLGLDTLPGPNQSGWLAQSGTNLVGRVQRSATLPNSQFSPVPADFQIRWNRTDTTANGKWLYPGDTLLTITARKVVVCPFRIVNVSDATTFRVVVNNAATDSMWRPGRELTIVTGANPIKVYTAILFSAPAGKTLVLPTAGDIYEARTSKPFQAGDQFTFTATGSKFDPATTGGASLLDAIYVVPNPYVAFSDAEMPGPTSQRRGNQQLQFRNLPPRCTIRIYTMVGELIDTIEKDDATNFASWRILSNEGQRLAYGVYLYHVDAPGIGQKIGRFALIK